MNLLLGILLLITGASCANILIVYETARRSHQIWIEALAGGLIKKGHNITMGGSFSRAMEPSDHYHPITFEGIFLTHYKFNKTEHLSSSFLQKLNLNYNYNYAICNRTYQSNGFRALWNYPDNFTFDLIIMDLTFGPCLYPLIHRFGNPYTIGFSPSALTPYLSDMFGNGCYPSYVISPHLALSETTTFLGRIQSYVFTKLEILFKRAWERKVLEKLAKSMLNETFNFSNLEKSISLLLVNDYPLLNEAQPLTPNIIPVGGMHIKPVEPMPGVLNAIINNANQGIVFYTLGTDIQQNIFSKDSKDVIAEAFMRLVQKTVIWKDKISAEDHTFLGKLSNILIHKWMPQNDLLAHPHTKLLVTTGGSLSIQEAIHHGVPVVGIPIYGEHHRNIKFITDNKLGLKLDYNNLTEDNVFEAVNTVLQNPIFMQNMGNLSKKFRDQPQNPLKKAVYWVEYVLRHNATNGADFLTPKSRDMYFSTVCSLDVQIFLLILPLSAFFIVFIFVFLIFKCSFSAKNAKTVKLNKSKRE